MATRKPEFYLASADSNPTIGPRACYIQQRLSPTPTDEYPLGYEYLLVKIEPRLHWETALGTIDTDELVLAQRGMDLSGVRPIHPTARWTGWVNAAQILNQDVKRTGEVLVKDVDHILIAELWPTKEEAEESLRRHLGPFDRSPWI